MDGVDEDDTSSKSIDSSDRLWCDRVMEKLTFGPLTVTNEYTFVCVRVRWLTSDWISFHSMCGLPPFVGSGSTSLGKSRRQHERCFRKFVIGDHVISERRQHTRQILIESTQAIHSFYLGYECITSRTKNIPFLPLPLVPTFLFHEPTFLLTFSFLFFCFNSFSSLSSSLPRS